VAALSDDRTLRSLKALQLQAQVLDATTITESSLMIRLSQGLNTSSSSGGGYGYSQQQHSSSSSSWVSGSSSKQMAPPSIKDRSIPMGHHSSNTSDLYVAASLFCLPFV
jgi:hypothetical protein